MQRNLVSNYQKIALISYLYIVFYDKHNFLILVLFSFSFNQTILCGMGELHIEIIHDRIKREYGLETYLGPLQVAYRETILNVVHATGKK